LIYDAIFNLSGSLICIYFLSYQLDWEHAKKHWQKGKPFSRFDKILGMSVAIITFLFSIFLFFKSVILK